MTFLHCNLRSLANTPAGVLAHVDVGQARAIHEAVIEGRWQTARELLDAVMQGKLSGSA